MGSEHNREGVAGWSSTLLKTAAIGGTERMRRTDGKGCPWRWRACGVLKAQRRI
ncbi:hypothetical protein P4S88_11765 [Anoxybacillus geothermalis]|nr:hypothetical protein [Anoxybacillus geothermalis]